MTVYCVFVYSEYSERYELYRIYRDEEDAQIVLDRYEEGEAYYEHREVHEYV